MKQSIVCLVVLIFIYSCQSPSSKSPDVDPQLRDSILTHLGKFDNNSSKEISLKKTFQFVQQIKNDSLQIKYLVALDFRALNSNSKLFYKINKLAREKANKYKDTTRLAKFYWNLGDSYLNENKTDFAYYAFNEAGFLYNLKKDLGNYAQMLYNLAIIQGQAKDFTGTEVNLIKVAEISKKIRNFDLLYKAFNVLGVTNYNLRNFDVALKYLNNALQALGKVDDPDLYRAATFNNIGNVYEKQKNFELAIKNYRKTLSTKNLYERDPYLYAMALDNLAFNRLESGETQNVLPEMENALEIRQNIKHLAGISISQIHISEYYRFTGNTTKAVEFASSANCTAFVVFPIN